MNIFDGIEKLINEHGSAKILGERLLLAKDQNTAQEKRISELDTQLKQAQTEISTLRQQLQNNREENERTTKEIQNFHNLPHLIFKPPFYYANGDQIPYCPTCWETDHVPIHFPPPRRQGAEARYICPKCKNNIDIKE
jgi:hypothetical protein